MPVRRNIAWRGLLSAFRNTAAGAINVGSLGNARDTRLFDESGLVIPGD
jgi:hypothetical protein